MKEGSKRDVLIVGASFAGLATANFIEKGDVLILERQKALGLNQRSTCCTSLRWMEKLGCKRSVLHSFDYLTMHSSNGTKAKIRLPETFCTIDYKLFCNTLAKRLKNTEIWTGKKALGFSENAVETEDGSIAGGIIVDASGWPGISQKTIQGNNKKPAFGLEIETEFNGDSNSSHIYYGKRYIKKGYGWVFPTARDTARIGIGGYLAQKAVIDLDHFLRELDIKRNGQIPHGGHLPLFGLKKPGNENIFVVGDSGNHVLPASGEGIRKAFEHGEFCGKIVSRILKGEIELSEGLKKYQSEVMKSCIFYDNLRFIQILATYCPDWARNRIIGALAKSDGKRIENIIRRYVSNDITVPRARIIRTVIGGIIS